MTQQLPIVTTGKYVGKAHKGKILRSILRKEIEKYGDVDRSRVLSLARAFLVRYPAEQRQGVAFSHQDIANALTELRRNGFMATLAEQNGQASQEEALAGPPLTAAAEDKLSFNEMMAAFHFARNLLHACKGQHDMATKALALVADLTAEKTDGTS